LSYEVLLINAGRYFFEDTEIPRFHKIAGLGILCALANNHNYKTKIFQGDPNKAIKILEKEISLKNLKLVGFYCHHFNQTEVISLAKFIKNNSNLPVIVGGPQGVSLAEDFFLKSGADVVVRGEGEETFVELLHHFWRAPKSLPLNDIAGITFMSPEGKLVKTAERPLIENLDAIPFLSDDTLPESSPSHRNIGLLTGRGCPFSCTFCYEGHHAGKVRLRSVENVLKEVEEKLAVSSSKYNYISFYDDTFTLDTKRIAKMCAGLVELRKKYNFVWFCEGHVSFLIRHPEVIPTMIDAGMVRMQLGVESGSQAVLDAYNKKITVAEIEEVIKICARFEVPQIIFNIIIGGALESEETFQASLDFAKKLLKIEPGMIDINPSLYMPLPNTPMTLQPEKFGIKIVDPESYTTCHNDYPVVETTTLSRERIFDMNNHFKRSLLALMKSLLGDISMKRLLNIFELRALYGITPNWYGPLAAEEHRRLYLQQIVAGAVFLKDVSQDEKNSLRPIRTVRLLEYDDIGYKIHFYNLSTLESQVLLHSAGRLTIKEQADILWPKLGGGSTPEKFLEKVIDCHHTFERRFWMNFSQY
jgi:radical SAM superfamily enzyme YgiQ (UPF0313 family)